MDLSTFLQQRRPDWRRLDEMLERVEGSGLSALEDAEAVEFGRLYRRAASDLNQAQTFVSGDVTVRYLNDLVARCYLVIYGRRKADIWGLVRFLVWEYPAVFRRNLGPILLATVIFTAGTVVGLLASYFEPEAARSYLFPANFPMIQPNEEGQEDPTPLQSKEQLAAFSAFLFMNNMSVTLIVCALGMTLGIGTAWLLFSNGILTGALMAVFVEAGQLTAFATGILPHGVVEIPAILIGGGAGFVLARGIIRARPWPRGEELARAGKEAMFLVGGCFPLLIAAAILEAGIARAPDWFLSSGFKLTVAGVVGLLFLAYVSLLGWGNSKVKG